MDDEFAAFMSEISSISSDPKPAEEPPAATVPKKRGLPAAYRNRTGFYESEAAKTRRIEKAIDESSDRQPVQKKLADATISAAPVRKYVNSVLNYVTQFYYAPHFHYVIQFCYRNGF